MKKKRHSKLTGRLKRSPPHHIDSNTKPLPYPQRPVPKRTPCSDPSSVLNKLNQIKFMEV